MDDRVLAAADNNARWCDLMCRLHGIPTATESGYWVARRRSPDLYPDAVTLLPHAAAEDVLRLADVGPGCSVKDSFGTLDLERGGFGELFQARWIFREPVTSSAESPSTESWSTWSVVETEKDLAAWAAAHGALDTFRGELVRDPSVRVLAAHGSDGLSAGAIANCTPSCVGVTNVFTTSMAATEAWSGITDILASCFPSLPLVSYEHGEGLEAALASGFTEIGSLRIWLRPNRGVVGR